MSKYLSELLVINPTKKPRKASTPKKWRWEDAETWDLISKHPSETEARANTPTKKGKYNLLCGSSKTMILIDTIEVE
jgi:hypothetical protein